MELPILPKQTWGRTLFWGAMLLCAILTLACIFLAIREVGQPWRRSCLQPLGTGDEGERDRLCLL